MMHRFTLASALLLVATACGDGTAADAGASDAAMTVDAAIEDAGAADAGPGPDAAVADAAVADGGAPAPTPGRHDHVLMVDGAEREVIVYVPEAVTASAPAVLMLHGTSGDGARFFNISGWREKADEVGLIAVFPSALSYCLHEDDNGDGDFDDPGERKVTTKWAAGELGDPARMPLCDETELAALPADRRALVDHPLHDDVAFMGAILDLLEADYAVDRRRIYASGFSNGAQMTSRLAVEMADRFGAIGAAAGALAVPAVPASRPLSLLSSLGANDDGIAEALGVASLPLDETLLTDYPPMVAVMTNYRTVLGLDDGFTHEARMVSGATVSRFTYASSPTSAGNELQVLVIDGLSHQYPNGRNHPVVLVDVLWEFFQRHPLPE